MPNAIYFCKLSLCIDQEKQMNVDLRNWSY